MALPNVQQIAAVKLGAGVSQAQTARDVGVDQSTVARWMKTAEFREAVADSLQASLIEAGAAALAELTRELSDSNVFARQNAARDILTRCQAALAVGGSKEVTITLVGAPAIGMPRNESFEDAQ